jgi:hypothetical protein
MSQTSARTAVDREWEGAVPHKRPEEIEPNDRWDAIGGWRAETWGDFTVAYTDTGPADFTYVYQDLPGGVCPCPHYMYLFEGRMRATYPGTDKPDEVVEAGEVCFIGKDHILIYEEPTKALEFNPKAELGVLMDAVNDVARQMQQTAED